MAIPVASANSPEDGYIAWESFSIQYLGQTFTIPSGNTNHRWVWWKYNSGGETTLLDAGADLPADLTDNDLVILGNKNGIPIRIQTTSLIDGDLLIDGSVVTKALAADAVTAEVVKAGSLTGDLFSAQVVLGSTLSTGEVGDDGILFGARASLGPEGITALDEADEYIFRVPLSKDETAFLKARVELISADVLDDFVMHGKNNALASESELTLAEGIVAPTAPVGVTAVYDNLQLDIVAAPPWAPGDNMGTFALNPPQITSMVKDPEWNVFVIGEQRSNGFRLWRYEVDGNPSTQWTNGKPWVDDFSTWLNSSCCWDGDEISIFGQYGLYWYVMGRTPSGARVINRVPLSWVTDTRPPMISYDHLNNQYMLCQSNPGNDTFQVRRFTLNPDNGNSATQATSQSLFQAEATSAVGTRINACIYGNEITGGGIYRYVVNTDAYSVVIVFNPVGTQMNDDGSYENWSKPTLARALCHDGTRFCSIDSTAKITFYENWTWPEANEKAYVAVSAFDSDTAGSQINPHPGQLPGQHETPVGPPLPFTMRRRAKIRFTVPETNDSGGNDDPDKWRLYFARRDTPPTAAQLKMVAQLGSPTSASTYTMTADPTGAAPPGGISGTAGAVNNFPGGVPATIESARLDLLGEPLIKLSGNGAWRLGHLAGNSDGTNANDSDWVNVTPASGYAHVSGDPGQIRMIDGQVFFKGRLRRSSGSSTTAGSFPSIYSPPANIGSMIRCGNAWIPWVITSAGGLVISSAVVTGDDINLASAAGLPYLAD